VAELAPINSFQPITYTYNPNTFPNWISLDSNTQTFTILSSTQGTGSSRNYIITITATVTNPDGSVKTVQCVLTAILNPCKVTELQTDQTPINFSSVIG
jgi:hypothetical protein